MSTQVTITTLLSYNDNNDHHLCREDQTGDCNAFRYLEDSGSCDLAKLTFLEDPNVGKTPLEVMH